MNTRALGDNAYERQEFSLALDYYEEAFAEGVRDPEVYFRAAKAATAQGAFSQAERYYSQALRHGGDVHVARALAEFYIQTSNFAQAVRVYQYLMRVEEDVQPVYSNLGTALMYSGKYLEAESFLTIAQQMNPTDPVPYINLGVLYDRHIRNRPRSVAFYSCFVELSADDSQRRMVQNRLLEMLNEGAVDASRVGLECGQLYRVPEPADINVRAELEGIGEPVDLGFGDAVGAPEGEVEIEALRPDDALPDKEGADVPSSVPEVGRPTEEEPASARPAEAPTSESPQTKTSESVEAQAAAHFEAGRYDGVVAALHGLQGRSQEGDRYYALALYRTGRFADAVDWLKLTEERQPSPEVVGALVDTYRRLGRRDALASVCERFAGWPDYEAAVARCPKSEEGAVGN
ncbi:tetratricopeptide repeat protein [Lujinxingia litoralis]|uniref:tetratricopeptide repeat protein n=1 Tax=Lujinxingia litoralis TaxID=2211119 RepID=UPI001314A061|nr:tetratricopeptide repeat protein [Lujinxingia litoralis]